MFQDRALQTLQDKEKNDPSAAHANSPRSPPLFTSGTTLGAAAAEQWQGAAQPNYWNIIGRDKQQSLYARRAVGSVVDGDDDSWIGFISADDAAESSAGDEFWDDQAAWISQNLDDTVPYADYSERFFNDSA
jgi:hypothetical protein